MSLPPRKFSSAWILVAVCALGFIGWSGYRRAQHVDYISKIDAESAVVDATSPTGYAHGRRWLIVPEHNYHSYQWIADTQQMFARGEWRVRRVETENAPIGREVHTASPYRWWLGLLAWCDHILSGRPLGLAVERAALVADPLLHLILLAATVFYVARRFDIVSAALLSVGLAVLFPLAGTFLPGVPDHSSLSLLCLFWSVLPLLVATGQAQARRGFFFAGVAGGLGLWISVGDQVPVLAGIALGGLLAATATRLHPSAKNRASVFAPLPWLEWSLGGAITCLLAYVIEYFPAHMDSVLGENHPLYGVAWLGLGGMLSWLGNAIATGKANRTRRGGLILLASGVALASLPAAMVILKSRAFLASDLLDARLTNLPGGTVAKNIAVWIARDGVSSTVIATLLPTILLLPAAWLLLRRQTNPNARTVLALALGPAVIALALAVTQLHWWAAFDALLLIALVAAGGALVSAPADDRRTPWAGAAIAGVLFLPGLIPLLPSISRSGRDVFSPLEVQSLIERSLAHWLAEKTTPPVRPLVLAPPDCTASLCFYGDVRGLGTPNPENADGIAITARIVGELKPDTAQGLLTQRGVTHLILPSWDRDLDEFARLTSSRPQDSFLHALYQWSLPPWLRPLPYRLPTVAGFEGQTVAILEVNESNNRTAGLSRLAEYFLEQTQVESALALSQDLQRYPADLGALVAVAQVQNAAGDTTGFAKTLTAILANLSGGYDRSLEWDRRVSLAVVLAQGGRSDPARDQVKRCLEKLDESRLRSLTTGSLFRLQVLAKTFDLPIADVRLRDLARALLPTELQARL